MKKFSTFILLSIYGLIFVGAAGCSKKEAPEVIDEVEEEETVTWVTLFFKEVASEDYWIRSVKIGHAAYELGGFTDRNAAPHCGEDIAFPTRYPIDETDIRNGNVKIVVLFNYYPTNTFSRQQTFEIPTSVFKEGACTPVEIQIHTPGIFQLYVHHQ
ncbi:hypothetical protein SAMN05421747_106153 [Parapedobacter composti]|uniref:Lipoprotein n=1 Tax=Parapedobacter composti TaxID=623281 RepID=A0A1I1HE29_9SPHI|nr:hypothetical protein [Parapedobacter composti]SFC22429.1 hypothetical protein SAMN05421747_106153 [Parapedobacter composti]